MAFPRSSQPSRVLLLAAMIFAAGGCAWRQAGETRPGALPAKASWFAGPRTSSGESIPHDALRRAMPAARQRLAPGTWTPAGPTNVGGRLTSIAVDPNDPDHVWIGAAAGGVFESRDAGTTWTPVFRRPSWTGRGGSRHRRNAV
jgi:hypothetical protein